MQIQLEQIRLEPYRWSEVLHVPPEYLEESDVLHVGEIAWQGEIRYVASGIGDSGGFRLTGSIEYDQTVRCMRCLEPVVQPVRSEIDLTIFVDAAAAAPGEYELDSDDLGVIFVDSEIFDVEPVILEQVELDVPMRTVCRDDCQGLCPECGVNRNQETCDCDTGSGDPRWSALADLKRNLDP